MQDRYDILSQIGRGAFADVYLCTTKSRSQKVVIKKTSFDPEDKDEYKSAINEVKCHSQLKHPNIIRYYDGFIEGNSLCIVMEFVPGGNLNELIKSKKKTNSGFDEMEALKLFCQICFAIQHMHEQNILHRDLKSHNIMLDKSHKIAKVGDFGISKLIESRGKTGSVVGTLAYLSPEVCKGIPYDKKNDIWALGCVLFEMLTLHYAFEAENQLALTQKICKSNVGSIPNHFGFAVKKLVNSMLSKDPDFRPCIQDIIKSPLCFSICCKLYCTLGMVVYDK